MATMTIGTLSRRTGVPVKALRAYEDAGWIYSVGRSSGNYRLFDDEALWCVEMIGTLRELGLTLAEIGELISAYLEPSVARVGPKLARALDSARERTTARIAELEGLLERIDEFESRYAAELAEDSDADFGTDDPRRGEIHA